MSSYAVPVLESPPPVAPEEVLLVASGDLRPSANKVCWAAQAEMEKQLTEALRAEGFTLRRAHPYREDLQHGFISNQRMGMDVFMKIHPDAPIIVAEAVWQYSHNVFSGLEHHRGPILTVANWSGQWPGLVGMLNLNGCLHKGGVAFSTLWSKDFKDEFFRQRSTAMAKGSCDRAGFEPRPRSRSLCFAASGERVGRVAGPRSQDAQGNPRRLR